MMKAMALEPVGRYATATAMLYDMDEFRKDPTILFDYNNASTELDAGVQLSNTQKETTAAAVTTAERVAGKTASGRSKIPERNRTSNGKKRRVREEIIEEEERTNKVATIAVISCSVVLVLAIIIILVVGFGSGNQSDDLVVVPNLVGKSLEEVVSQYPDIELERRDAGYSDVYRKDEIIEQKPDANTQIVRGGKVTVTVSQGPEPNIKTMEKLVDREKTTAMNYLTNIQGVKAEQIEIKEETHATIQKGRITRTDPVEGAELKEDMIITLWISTGPEVRTAKMPDLLNKGYNVETAKKILEQNGFTLVVVEEVVSSKTPGTVVGQSVEKEKEVPVDTTIVLQISKISQEPVTPPQIPSQEPADYVSKWVIVQLPEDMMMDYVMTVRQDGVVVEERNIPGGATEIEIELRGKGKMTFEVWIGNTPTQTLEVDFEQ